MNPITIKNNRLAEVELSYKNPVPYSQRTPLTGSTDVYKLLKTIWPEGSIDHRESFLILLLSHANRLLGYHVVSQGGVAGTVVDPKIVFQAAIKANASSIILSHNHPSGNCRPSDSDIRLTNEIARSGELLKITCLDHVILSEEGYYSFADEGLI